MDRFKFLSVLLVVILPACGDDALVRNDTPLEVNPVSGAEIQAPSANQTKTKTYEPVAVDQCNAGEILESTSSYYAGSKAAEVVSKNQYKNFSKVFAKEADIQSQGIIKYTQKSGSRVYETDPIIVFEPYEGTLKQVRKKIRDGVAQEIWPGRARYGYRYYWENGAFKKNPSTGLYFVEPTKFRVYLSFKVTVPEWRSINAAASSNEKKYWNRYICSLYTHERKHVEITRGHILRSVDETLTLRASSSEELEAKVRKEWDYRKTELRVKQKDFDTRTRHGAKPEADK